MAEQDAEFIAGYEKRRVARMDAIDQMTPEMRRLVNEYGYNVVKTLTSCGVTKPKHIRHVVETILNEFSPTRGSFSSQGVNAPVIPHSTAA